MSPNDRINHVVRPIHYEAGSRVVVQVGAGKMLDGELAEGIRNVNSSTTDRITLKPGAVVTVNGKSWNNEKSSTVYATGITGIELKTRSK